MTQWAWKAVKRRWGECQQCPHSLNPQIKLPSQRTGSRCGQKPRKIPYQRGQHATICLCPHRLLYHAPLWCTQTNESPCPVGVGSSPKGRSPQPPPPKSTMSKPPERLSSSPAAAHETSPLCPGCTDSRRQHLPQSQSDRQRSDGRQRSGAAAAPPAAQGCCWRSDSRLLHCSLNKAPAAQNREP